MPEPARPRGILVLAAALFLPAAWLLYVAGILLVGAVSDFGEIEGAEESDLLIFKTVAGSVGGVAVAVLGFLLLVLGRSLWSLRRWAHRTTLGLAILCVSFFGVLALLTLTERDWTRALGNLSAAAFAGWGVWYLNRPPVEQQFTPPAPATPPPLPPSNPQERQR